MNEKRSSFSGKLGFVLAAAGSAVGLGNIWRFPYLAAKYGGGIFLLVYIILAVTFGYALMTAEIAIGRKTGLSVVGAFKSLNKKFSFIGWLAALIPVIILPYYSVIGGWVMKYLYAFISGSGTLAAADGYFGRFISSAGEPVLWFCIFLGITALVVLFGVEKGIEKVSKVMMPVLIALSLAIAIYSLTMPGALEGLKYYVLPDFTRLEANTFGEYAAILGKTALAAMGQMFYSMSLAMGIMITYGSYMKKDVSIDSSVKQIEIFDTGVAFLAGLMIIPAVFAFSGGTPEALGAGPSLMFITLPKVFETMAGGAIIGAAFFILVLFAALTSSISLFETVLSFICDKTKLGRKMACLIVFVGSVLVGLLSCFGYSIWDSVLVFGYQFLDFFDFASNSVLMPVVAFLTCIFVGYVIKPKAILDEVALSGKVGRRGIFVVMIKYIAPIFVALILASSLFLSL